MTVPVFEALPMVTDAPARLLNGMNIVSGLSQLSPRVEWRRAWYIPFEYLGTLVIAARDDCKLHCGSIG